MNIEPTSKQVNLANNKPLAYVLCVIVLLLGVFVTLYFNSNSTSHADCQADKAVYQKQIQTLQDLLINQTKDYNTLKRNTDSVIRQKLKSKLKTHKNGN